MIIHGSIGPVVCLPINLRFIRQAINSIPNATRSEATERKISHVNLRFRLQLLIFAV